MIGDRLWDLRKDAGMTQDELAAVLSLSKFAISAYERGTREPPDSVKIAIARYFNVSVDYLLGMTRDPAPYKEHYTILKLPAGFPPQAKASLMDYAGYLKTRYADEPRENEK